MSHYEDDFDSNSESESCNCGMQDCMSCTTY